MKPPASGELEPLKDSLNKPMLKFGMDYRVFGLCLFGAILVFLVASKLGAVLALVAVCFVGRWVTRKDPQMVRLVCMSILQAAHYDPGKAPKGNRP
ncbi:MAG: VirB3 family type IV secretion system protein [Candidatus Acidiferrales bacterium]